MVDHVEEKCRKRTKQPQISLLVDFFFFCHSHVCLSIECLFAECGPSLGLSTQEVQKQASHCNDKKTVSKRVQELSSELFFGVFVKVSNQITTYCQQVGLVEKRCIFDG